MDRRLGRRTLLKSSVALFGGAAASLSPRLAAFARLSSAQFTSQGGTTLLQDETTLLWYALDPEWGAGTEGCPVDPSANHQASHACHACHKHGINKLFPSAEAANANRAHLGCKCTVVEGGELPADVWTQLFGPVDAVERQHVDRRWDWVAAILGSAPGEYDFAHEAFRRVWERTDLPVMNGIVSRSWLWSDKLPFTAGLYEPYEEGPSGERLVQYFDKSRMEITAPGTDPNSVWYVTNGLLVVELMTGMLQVGHNAFEEREPADVNCAGDPDDPDGPLYSSFVGVLDAPPLPLGAVISQSINRAGVVSTDDALAELSVTVGYIDEHTNHSIAARSGTS